MKKTIIMLLVIVLFIVSCNYQKKQKKDQKQEVFTSKEDYVKAVSLNQPSKTHQNHVEYSLGKVLVSQKFLCFMRSINDTIEIVTLSKKRVRFFIENDTLKTKDSALVGSDLENYRYFTTTVKDPVVVVDVKSFKEIK